MFLAVPLQPPPGPGVRPGGGPADHRQLQLLQLSGGEDGAAEQGGGRGRLVPQLCPHQHQPGVAAGGAGQAGPRHGARQSGEVGPRPGPGVDPDTPGLLLELRPVGAGGRDQAGQHRHLHPGGDQAGPGRQRGRRDGQDQSCPRHSAPQDGLSQAGALWLSTTGRTPPGRLRWGPR